MFTLRVWSKSWFGEDHKMKLNYFSYLLMTAFPVEIVDF